MSSFKSPIDQIVELVPYSTWSRNWSHPSLKWDDCHTSNTSRNWTFHCMILDTRVEVISTLPFLLVNLLPCGQSSGDTLSPIPHIRILFHLCHPYISFCSHRLYSNTLLTLRHYQSSCLRFQKFRLTEVITTVVILSVAPERTTVTRTVEIVSVLRESFINFESKIYLILHFLFNKQIYFGFRFHQFLSTLS